MINKKEIVGVQKVPCFHVERTTEAGSLLLISIFGDQYHICPLGSESLPQRAEVFVSFKDILSSMMNDDMMIAQKISPISRALQPVALWGSCTLIQIQTLIKYWFYELMAFQVFKTN